MKARQQLGKYRIVRRIGRGGFADVYRATDTLEGIAVALKIPHAKMSDDGILDDFRKEVRLTARLEHPNILPIKSAAVIDDRFVIAYPLGLCSLADRLARRLSSKRALEYTEQILRALAYAHENRIVHCDVKPENLILFDGDRLRLADFGIAKIAARTLRAAGTGTFGYIAPEQAFGRPSPRSDVFSAGLVVWRMFAGVVPEWPFEWPFEGTERVRAKVTPDFLAFLRRALEVEPRKRYRDGRQMLQAFLRLKKRALREAPGSGGRRRATTAPAKDWKTVRRRQFKRLFGKTLETRHACERCGGPVAEAMHHCPWCGHDRRVHKGDVSAPAQCPRCRRGVKTDWTYCAWCYGGAIGPLSDRTYADKRHTGRCTGCRGPLVPFARYCPWCRTKVRRKWPVEGTSARCRRCGWGVVPEYWSRCPWCGAALPARPT